MHGFQSRTLASNFTQSQKKPTPKAIEELASLLNLEDFGLLQSFRESAIRCENPSDERIREILLLADNESELSLEDRILDVISGAVNNKATATIVSL